MAGLFGISPPKVPAAPTPPPAPKEDTSAMEELARQRKSVEALRAGRSQLVIPREAPETGLRIIE